MQIIRVYRRSGGLAASFRGIHAEQKMFQQFGEINDNNHYFMILR